MNPFEGYRITSPFGWRTHPIHGTKEFHSGVDLVKSHKAPIMAFTDGVVQFAEERSGTGFGGFGKVVAVKDKNGAFHCYCHLDSISVRAGQVVKRGQEIGKQGMTGTDSSGRPTSTGSHLHYEIRKKAIPNNGWHPDGEIRCYDPTKYLVERKEEELMLEELKKQLEQLNKEVTDLKQRVEAPKWFIEEFGSGDLGGLINDPKFTLEGWRTIAVMLRAQKSHKLNAKVTIL